MYLIVKSSKNLDNKSIIHYYFIIILFHFYINFYILIPFIIAHEVILASYNIEN